MALVRCFSRPAKGLRAPLLLLAVLPAIVGCTMADEPRLQAIKRAGEVTVLTHTGTTTYYDTPEGSSGFEYELAKAFADHLGVRLRVVVADKFADVLPRLLQGEADFAAANIPDTATWRERVRFTPSYQHIRQHVIYRHGNVRPGKIEELLGREIEVPQGTPSAERLRELKQFHPELTWLEGNDRGPEEYLQLVWQGLLDLTVADSNVYAVNRQYFPELQTAFDLQEPQPIAWAFRPSPDASLYNEAVAFLQQHRQGGSLAQLIDKYYGPASRANFINLTVYRARIRNRLPLYQQLLEDAGKKYDIDWRLLAALAYQESYWDPKSISFTGVRGFMMLTRVTAERVGVTDREDPQASIDGGARYLRELIERLPARIGHPDRLWLALAGYNVGPHHLEYARVITQIQKGDPDKWTDVSKRLPLLADPKWSEKNPYGYARGDEPVHFVNRVRVYYEILAKLDEEEKAKRSTPAFKLKAPAI